MAGTLRPFWDALPKGPEHTLPKQPLRTTIMYGISAALIYIGDAPHKAFTFFRPDVAMQGDTPNLNIFTLFQSCVILS